MQLRPARRPSRREDELTVRHVDLSHGSIVVVQPGTPLQIRDENADKATLFIVGTPPKQSGADFFPNVD
jgi:hypothetical protein